MGRHKIIAYTTQAYTSSAMAVKGAEREKRLYNSDNSTSPKESFTHNLNGSDIFNKK